METSSFSIGRGAIAARRKRRGLAVGIRTGAAALALLASSAPLALGGLEPAAAAQARRPLQIGGTWDATWRNSRGASRKGVIAIEQRGAGLTARIESHGNVTASGSIAGSTFTLRGNRLGVPFTVTGRVEGRRMTGVLTSLLAERRFTAVRRRGR